MGYIFDALNRSNGNEHDKDGDKPLSMPPKSSHDDSENPSGPKLSISEWQPSEIENHDEQADCEPAVEKLEQEQLTMPDMDDETLLKSDDRLVALKEPASVIAEEYRSIRTGLLARWDQRRHLVHTITSATPQEGKTITSINLGLSFSELHNRKTIVVEADLRLPQFANLFGLPPQLGLVDYLEGDAQLNDIVTAVGDNQLHVIPAGRRSRNNTVQLLSSPKMITLLKTLRQRYDHIIIDTPPVIELADAGIVGGLSDDVLLIVRMMRTPRTLVDQAIRTLDSYNAPVVGCIATDHSRHQRKYYYYRYGYRYHYRYNKAA